MKRTAITAFISAAVLLVLLLFIFRGQSPFGRSNSSFAVEKGKEITAISISDGKRELMLESRDGKWYTGSGTEARKSGITFITAILEEMVIKSPVSDELFNDSISSRGIEPVKVKVYDGRKLLKSFLVFRTKSNKYGNVMKTRQSSKPFIVYLPGFEGDIGSVFTPNPLYWEPYVIFNRHPSEIESVSVDYPSDTASSFAVMSEGGSVSVYGGKRKLEGFDQALAARYVSYFTFIPFEEWALGLSDKDILSIQSEEPLCTIRMVVRGEDDRVLTLIRRRHVVNDSLQTDENRLYGRLDDKENLFIVRYFDIDPVLKKRSYFFPR